MATISVQDIKFYIEGGYNVLLQGLHGVGKTQMLREACDELGLVLKYYSASTMDPFTDFVGIPYPVENADGRRVLESVRPHEIDKAQVVFFDEFNRADPKVLNAVMEMLQFGTINGEPLPNLKCVIAAQNPPDDDYNVISLDKAIVDRFDFFAEVPASPDKSYLVAALGRDYGDEGKRVAAALIDWVKEHKTEDSKHAEYISPRKIEKIGRTYIDFTKRGANYNRVLNAMEHILPPGQAWDHARLTALLYGDATQDMNNADYDFSNADPEWLIETADKGDLGEWFKNQTDPSKREMVLAMFARIRIDHVAPKFSAVLEHINQDEYNKYFRYGEGDFGKPNVIRREVFRTTIEQVDQTPELSEEARERILSWIPPKEDN